MQAKANLPLYFIYDKQRHLVCLPYNKANLHVMADVLGIKRCWFHRDHYDIPKRRIAEIENSTITFEASPKVVVKIIQGKFDVHDFVFSVLFQ